MRDHQLLAAGALLKQKRYRIVRFITAGGFGAVYLAEDTIMQRRLCVLKESFDSTPEGRKQFEIEAATLSTLNHPHLVRVTDNFIDNQRAYMVMEYVEGEDLEDILRRSPGGLPEQQVLEWMDQILDAVAYCHGFTPKVVHRDIKPGNIRIRKSDGKAVLVDFGIAKIGGKATKTQRAAQGVTPGYSPLEQYGTGTDTYSDVYALGATMYHLLTGQIPPEAVDIAYAGARLKPPRELNPSISPQTEQVILTAMQIRPQSRYPTAREMRLALHGQHLTRLCPHCRAAVRVDAQYCQACGKPITLTRPLVFPGSGYQAHTADDLVRGCDGLWEEAADLFWSGFFDSWLVDINEAALAQAARTIRAQHSDASAALEEFLEMASPTRSRPVLALSPTTVNFGRLYRGESKSQELKISNSGRGYLYGEIILDSPHWLSARPTRFGCLPGVEHSVRVEVKTNSLSGTAQGTQHTGRLVVRSNQGTRTVAVQVTVMDPPILNLTPQRLKLGTVQYGKTAKRRLTISNQGGGVLKATLHTEAWLPFTDASGQRLGDGSSISLALQRGQAATVNLTLDSSQVATRGHHRGTIQVEAPEARNPVASIPVTVTVEPPFLLDLADPNSAIGSKDELWRWCDGHWRRALRYLADGRLEACLQFIGEASLAGEARRRRGMADQAAGLETLLRACGAPPPQEWETNELEIEGQLGYGLFPKLFRKPDVLTFKVLNKSDRGYLHGRIEPIASWLAIPDPHFGCRPGEISEITIQVNRAARPRKLFWASEALLDIVIE